jgi:hypothetical protein
VPNLPWASPFSLVDASMIVYRCADPSKDDSHTVLVAATEHRCRGGAADRVGTPMFVSDT